MLESLIALQRPLFDKMAQEWLNLGASAFSVRANGRVLAQWPSRANGTVADCTTPIHLHQEKIGELCISGLASDTAVPLLQTEAELVEAILSQEQELDSVISALVDVRDQMGALQQLTLSTRSALNVDELLKALAREAVDIVGAENAFIWVDLGNGQQYLAQHPHSLLSSQHIHLYLQQLNSSSLDFLSQQQVEDSININNILIVPIKMRFAENALMGVINKKDGAFTTLDTKLARTVADYAGAQIENVLSYLDSLDKARLRQEMELANRVQVQLFPKEMPHVPNIDFWAKSEPASHVGGDFFDYCVDDEGCLTFVVGDVSGKGIASALLMAMTRSVIRTQMQNSANLSPSAIIERANAALFDDFSRVNMFATVFVGKYDPASRTLVYSNSGHSPVIHCPVIGHPESWEADGLPLGILTDYSIVERSMQLKPGESLVVGSDGIYEVHDQWGVLYGIDRLINVLGTFKDKSASDIGESILNLLAEFSAGMPQADDRTMLILRPIRTQNG